MVQIASKFVCFMAMGSFSRMRIRHGLLLAVGNCERAPVSHLHKQTTAAIHDVEYVIVRWFPSGASAVSDMVFRTSRYVRGEGRSKCSDGDNAVSDVVFRTSR